MARSTKRRKFSNNQTVVFRFGDRNIVGQVVFVRPVGKRFIYDVAAEDGKIYYELPVDVPYNETIDTYLTRLFYKKYKMDEDGIPEIEDEDGPILNVTNVAKSLIEVEEPEIELEPTGMPATAGRSISLRLAQAIINNTK